MPSVSSPLVTSLSDSDSTVMIPIMSFLSKPKRFGAIALPEGHDCGSGQFDWCNCFVDLLRFSHVDSRILRMVREEFGVGTRGC